MGLLRWINDRFGWNSSGPHNPRPITKPRPRHMIHGWEAMQCLRDAGVIPPHCQRILIDVPCDDIVRVYTQCVGDEHILDVDWNRLVKPEDGPPPEWYTNGQWLEITAEDEVSNDAQ